MLRGTPATSTGRWLKFCSKAYILKVDFEGRCIVNFCNHPVCGVLIGNVSARYLSDLPGLVGTSENQRGASGAAYLIADGRCVSSPAYQTPCPPSGGHGGCASLSPDPR